MTPTEHEELYTQWPDGMLRCEASSPVKRLALGDDSAYPRVKHADESLPDIHTQMIIDPQMIEYAALDVRSELERRLLLQLVEFGVKEHVWPIAPVIRWQVWDAYVARWYGMHWPPKPPTLSALRGVEE